MKTAVKKTPDEIANAVLAIIKEHGGMDAELASRFPSIISREIERAGHTDPDKITTVKTEVVKILRSALT